jgi:hypothetical protein
VEAHQDRVGKKIPTLVEICGNLPEATLLQQSLVRRCAAGIAQIAMIDE